MWAEPAKPLSKRPAIHNSIMPKLKVGRPGDRFEKQADRVADAVMRMPKNHVQRQTVDEEEQTLQMQSFDEEDKIRMQPFDEEEEQLQMQQQAGAAICPDYGEHLNQGTNFNNPNCDIKLSRKQEGIQVDDVSPRSSIDLNQKLTSTRGKGNKLPQGLMTEMSGKMGADFSSIKVHTDSDAVQMNRQLKARAFTSGSDIYFNDGQYQPETEEGRHLIAHELTHTIQQGGGEQGQSVNNNVVQPSLLDSVASSLSNRLRDAAEWVGESLSEGLSWLRNQLSPMVSSLPGYGLFTVFMGHDPITGNAVQRSGRNFINHGLDIIPNGHEYKQKLEEEGALDEAAAWIDTELAKLNLSVEDILEQFSMFWDSLGLSDVRNPGRVFDRLVNIFEGPINRLVSFAINLARKFLEIVKNYLLGKLREFVENQESPTWYPLLTVVLGNDPIMDKEVERNGENILTGFIRLHPEGDEQLARMQETGTFQKAVEWINNNITRIQNIASGLRTAFSATWEAVTDINSLIDPVGTFTKIYQVFRVPIAEMISFAAEVSEMIIRFVKDALLRRLSEWAKNTWGYPLLTVLLGKDPFTKEEVLRTPKNIIRGFILLLPGGEEKYSRLEEIGAIDKMLAWIETAVASLNITLDYILSLFTGLWHSLTLKDFAAPLNVFVRIINTFSEPVARITAFIWEVMKAMVTFTLQLMNFPFETINSIVNNAMQAYEDIKRDPIGFFLNLLAAVKLGFSQFFDNILAHLQGGLQRWLFSELNEAGISPPADLSFRSILGFVLDVLGITMSNIWARLAEKIGPERAQQLESIIDRASGAWSFVKDVYERGPIAIWEYIQGRLSNLWDMVMEQIRNWIVTRIIQKVTVRLLSMLDPSGIMAVVNSFIAFYSAVQSFIEKMREMLEIVNSFVAGVANVAKGVIGQAANYLENALSDGIPVAISFLANQVGLRGLGSRVAGMIENARGYVNAAIDWLIDRALSAGSAFMEIGRSAVASVRDWWSQKRPVKMQDGSSHELYFSGTGPGARMMMASSPQTYEGYLNQLKEDLGLSEDVVSEARSLSSEIDGMIEQNVPEDQQEEHRNRVNEKVDLLASLTASLPLPESGGTNTDPVYGPLRQDFGTFARVKYLATPHPAGSEPKVQPTPEYRWINIRRQHGGSNYYVRGHLLNEQLGGPGNTWSNLTALTVKANNDHKNEFENPIKSVVNKTKGDYTDNHDPYGTGNPRGYVENFEVRAKYGRSLPKSYSQLVNYDTDDYPSNMPENINIENLIQLLKAEQYVPTKLICSAKLTKPTAEGEGEVIESLNASIPNCIHYGILSEYSLDSTPKKEFKLSTKVDEATDKQAAINDLSVLKGIGPVRAGKIYDRIKIKGKTITNYTKQIGISKKKLDLDNSMYNIKQ